ncbi:MAG: hypothetical protein CL947_01785 [Epsilonproteobacteria bacterium]|nr:hypothetical protein [Campylobacterota bacterium]|tara:strand:- start:4473 stop:6545 length:2073 start_codon:yes stop_codon:yes gene_type:complete
MLCIVTFVLNGCKRKQGAQERLCTRIDIDRIIDLLPTTNIEAKSLADSAIQTMNDMITSLDSIPAQQKDFSNTIRAYDSAKFHFLTHKNILSAVSVLASDTALQTAAHQQLHALNQYETDVLDRNATIYQALKDYYDYGKDTQRKTVAGKHFLQQMLQRFEHKGVLLPVAQRADIVKLEQQINQLAGQYAGNIVYDTRSLVMPQDDLYGLPSSFMQTLQQNEQGNYVLPLDYETFFMVMENCLVQRTRQEYFVAFGQRAYPQNVTVLQQLLKKRHQLATYFNYPDFASYQLSNQMVKTPKRAEHFLWGLVHQLQKYDQQDFEEVIKNLPPSVTLTKSGQLNPWDEALVKSWYRKKHFHVDDYQLSDYFPLEHTLTELFRLFHNFFHIEFIKQDGHEQQLWGSDVICYKVRSLTKQVVLGYLFLDLYKHSYKRITEPCHMMLIPTIKDDCSIPCAGASVVVANFNTPVDDKPTLLELHDVKTLFHELGHALHALFGSACFADFAGTQVVKDFVEVPSLMLEYWLDDPSVIRFISSHYQTNQHLSHDKIEQIVSAQKFGLAGRMLKQLFLSLVALQISRSGHDTHIHKMIEKLYKAIFKHIAYDPHHYLEYNFTHMANYAASYYTYVWSRVIAADLFQHIQHHGGIHSNDIGKEYVHDILNPGGFVPPYSMIKKFLNRPFNNKAFLQQFETK